VQRLPVSFLVEPLAMPPNMTEMLAPSYGSPDLAAFKMPVLKPLFDQSNALKISDAIRIPRMPASRELPSRVCTLRATLGRHSGHH
jgi:hypothetical protein